MYLAVTPFHPDDIPALINAGADIFIAGNAAFANRLATSFSMTELEEMTKVLHQQGKQIYVPLNLIVHELSLETLEPFLTQLRDWQVDGILFGDLAVYQIAKRLGMEDRLIYHPETLNTNTYDPIFWAKQGIGGVVLAKEITLTDIEQIYQASSLKIVMVGHGHLNMFHSRRPLIESYFKHKDEAYQSYLNNRNLRLVEEIRSESYPIMQDEHGTHIFRERPMMSYLDMPRLRKVVDVFIIDGILQTPAELLIATKNYKTLGDNPSEERAKQLHDTYSSTHDTGFLHQQTVYVKQ